MRFRRHVRPRLLFPPHDGLRSWAEVGWAFESPSPKSPCAGEILARGVRECNPLLFFLIDHSPADNRHGHMGSLNSLRWKLEQVAREHYQVSQFSGRNRSLLVFLKG